MTRPIAKWLGIFGLWMFVGFVLSTEVYFNLRVSKPEISFLEVAETQYLRAILWAALAPFILWLRVKVPISQGRYVGGVFFHLIVSLVIMVGYYLGRIVLLLLQEGDSLNGFWLVAQSSFFGRNLIDAAFYWAVLGAGYSLELYRRFKNEELKAAQLEGRLYETELKALKQQLHPHFLFNTMNNVAVLIREGRNDDAVALLARLSSLLRLSIDSAGVQEVTLRQELEFIERYVEIQKMRFEDRLTVHTLIEPAALEARIPNLLLQPLVENAILHGIAPRTEPGTVKISGRVENGRLLLGIEDNGLGFNQRANGTARTRQGIGLSNTRERLAKTYGPACQFVLSSKPGEGTSVQMNLPYNP